MLSVFLRATRLCKPNGQAVKVALVPSFKTYASFKTQDVLNETCDEAGTLLIRFAKHIAINRYKWEPLVPTTIRYPDYFPVSDMRYFLDELRRTSAEQLPSLIVFTSTYRSNAEPQRYVRILNEIDAHAVSKLPDMNEETILRILYALLFLLPNWITRTDFYRAGVRKLVEIHGAGDASKEKFVQLCFYLGLDKKQANPQHNMLQSVLDEHLEKHLPQLSTLDLAIVSSAAYKTSTKISDNGSYKDRLINEVLKLEIDSANDALLVNFVKAMRLQRIHSESVCERLSSLCSDSSALQQLQARGLVHLFAYFAENRWDKSESIEALIDEFVQRLCRNNQFETQGDAVRGKDIAMFLWCCAQLNCAPAKADLQRIEAILLRKARNNEFRYFADQLVDCTLWLWAIGFKSRNLLEETVQVKSKTHGKSLKDQPKVESRLTVLSAAVAIENPTWASTLPKSKSAFDLNATVPAYLLKNRDDLTQYTEKVRTETDVSEVQLTCPINGINIPGLLVTFNAETMPNTTVFVDLLTDEQTLHFSEDPVAIVRLKSRLLNALGHKAIVLQARELKEKYTSLKDLILEAESSDDQSKEQTARNV